MADPINLHKGPAFETPDYVVNGARDALETLLVSGVSAVFLSAERPDGMVVWAAVPNLMGFIRGHLDDLYDCLKDSSEDA